MRALTKPSNGRQLDEATRRSPLSEWHSEQPTRWKAFGGLLSHNNKGKHDAKTVRIPNLIERQYV